MKTLFSVCSVAVTLFLLSAGLYVLTISDLSKTEWFWIQSVMAVCLMAIMAGMMHITTEWHRGRREHSGPGVSENDAFMIGCCIFTPIAAVVVTGSIVYRWLPDNTRDALAEWAVFAIFFAFVVEYAFNPFARLWETRGRRLRELPY